MTNKQHNRPKIAFLTVDDPQDRRSWSGAHYSMFRALQKHCGDVVALGPVEVRFRNLVNRTNRIRDRLGWPPITFRYSARTAKRYAAAFRRKLAGDPFDFIFASAASVELMGLETSLPVVYTSDATFMLMRDYYPLYSAMSPRAAEFADLAERKAIRRADVIIYPSQWAAGSAIRDYQADESKVHVFSYGTNIDHPPDRQTVLERHREDECKLLFLGRDWERKGGPIAFDTLIELEKLGLSAQLIICGCTPPRQFNHESMTVVPYLNMNDEAERSRLFGLFMGSSFLLQPTRRESLGFAPSDSSAFGLPAITTDTGGVSSVVINGENGMLLPPEARGAAYARVVYDIWQDPPRYRALVESSRRAYEDRLNWDAWGRSVCDVVRQHLGGAAAAAGPQCEDSR